MPRIMTQASRTIHLVTREVSLPAIWWCMGSLHHGVGTDGIGVFPEVSAGKTRRGGRTHRWDATTTPRGHGSMDRWSPPGEPPSQPRGAASGTAAGLRGEARFRPGRCEAGAV